MSNDYPPPGPGQDPADESGQPPPQPPSEPQWNPQSPGTPPPSYGDSQPPGYGQPGYGQQSGQQPGQPPGYPPPPPAGYGGYGQPQRTSPLAIVSLVLGILGIPCCSFFVLGVAAAVTGFIARKQIGDSNGQLKGAGMAMAGLVLGIIGTIVGLVLLILRVSGVLDSSFDMQTN
ncbi:MAG: hypothetical protein JWR85_477 [Marmoricola sp.]|nr:hypothetical protein [Marmoricola sp.]